VNSRGGPNAIHAIFGAAVGRCRGAENADGVGGALSEKTTKKEIKGKGKTAGIAC
jgi:hypothetical protein